MLFNPRSKRNKRDPDLADRLTLALGDPARVRGPRTLEDLDTFACELHEARPPVLAICGGDGTYHRTLTALVRAYGSDKLPALVLLRGGTMNTIPNGLGVRRQRPELLLHRLLKAPETLARTQRNVLRVGDRYGFLFGTGVMYGFLAEYYRNENLSALVAAQTLARGSLSALWGGATIKRIQEPFIGSVELPSGERWDERPYLAIACGALEQIGLGFKPFHRSGERPGCFHILGVHAGPMKVVTDLPRLWSGRGFRDAVATQAVVPYARLHSSTPIRYMIDGDLYQGTERELEIGAGPSVSFLV